MDPEPAHTSTAGVVAYLTACAAALVAVILRARARRPAAVPRLSRGSWRWAATTWLTAELPRPRRQALLLHYAGRGEGAVPAAPLVIALTLLWLPVPVCFGPLGNSTDSEDYLQTLWQVVAAALGVSVAMVAFAFEAYTSSAQHRHGGTLREFAGETHLLSALRLGITALVADGLVLFELGHDAPRGWAALWAIVLSAATLLSVPWVVSRILTTLDPWELNAMSRRRLEHSVTAAVRGQLVGQAARAVLEAHQPPFPRPRRLWPDQPHVVATTSDGRVTDVRIASLARLAQARRRQQGDFELWLHVELGDAVARNITLVSCTHPLTTSEQRRVRRSVRLRSSERRPRAEHLLTEQLDQLHRQALAAVRERDAEGWRAIADLYELVVLRLPQETTRLGIPFAGAVARPGLFGFGPLQRIGDFLVAEFEAAIEVGDRGIIQAMLYQPQAIAREAANLGAMAVAADMLSLYPRMYALARRMP